MYPIQVALMVSIVEQIESILELSQPDEETQRLYRNAWSYHCEPEPELHTPARLLTCRALTHRAARVAAQT